MIKNGLLWLIFTMPIGVFAQSLGATKGNSIEISSIQGTSTNVFRNKTWLYRDEDGNSWYTARLHDGINIDASFLTPKVDTKTWWERDPYNDIQAWGNAANTYILLKQGKVGIGTTSPIHKLDVNSGASAPATRSLSNSIVIGAKNANGNNKYLGQFGFVSDDENFSAAKMVAFISGEAAETYSNNSNTASVMRFFTGSVNGTAPVERMVINHKGFVGIGTPNPTEPLAVNGKIRAREIKVETVNWPDYVFGKEYKLPSLVETEHHIKEYGHLQGIPSAAEVKKDGVELGEMNKKLLQKIEELTLYVIQLNKVVAQQSKELEAIKINQK